MTSRHSAAVKDGTSTSVAICGRLSGLSLVMITRTVGALENRAR